MAESIGLEGIFDLRKFDAGIDSYIKGMKQADSITEKSTKGFGSAFDSMGSSVTKAAALVGTVFVGAATAAGAAVAGFVASGIKGAMDLESQMGAIAATMGETKDAVAPLKDLIMDLGIDPNLKVSATEAADAIERLASNGITMTEILDGAAKSTVLLANATGADFGTAADVASDTMAIFNIEAGDMMEAVNGITSVIVASKFGINDYALALSQGGAVFATAGGEIDDFNTIITATASAFNSGSQAGTSLKTMILRLVPTTANAEGAMKDLDLTSNNTAKAMEYLRSQGIDPTTIASTHLMHETYKAYTAQFKLTEGTDEAAEAFGKWAIETGVVQSAFYDASGSLKDMDEVTSILHESLEGLSEMEKATALNAIFGQDAIVMATEAAKAGAVAYTDQTLAAKELGVSYESLTSSMEGGLTVFEGLQAQMAQTDAAESARLRMDNFKGSLEILQGVIETLGLQIGFAFLPMLKAMADQLAALVGQYAPMVIAFFTQFAERLDAVASGASWETLFPAWVGTVIDVMAANMDLLVGAMSGLAVLLASAGIAAAISAIGVAIAAVLSPIGLLIIGSAALGAAWNTNFLGIKDITLSVLDPIQKFVSAMMNLITVVQQSGAFSIEAASALALFAPSLQGIVTSGLAAYAVISNFVTAVQSAGAFSVQANEALALFPTNLQPIVTWSLTAWSALTSFVTAVQSAGLFSTEAGTALGLLGGVFGQLVTSVTSQLPLWIAQLSLWGTAILQWLTDASLLVAAQVTTWYTSLSASLTAQLPAFQAILLGWGNASWQWLLDAATSVGTYVTVWSTALVASLAANLPSVILTMLEYGVAFTGWILTATGETLVAIAGWGAALVGWLVSTGVPQLTTSAIALSGALSGWITNDLIPKLSPLMTQVGATLVASITTMVTELGASAIALGTAIQDGILAIDWNALGTNVLTMIKDGWVAIVATVLPILTELGTSVSSAFNGVDWASIGADALNAIKDGWISTVSTVLPMLVAFGTSVTTQFLALDWKKLGSDALTAIGDGWESAKTAVLSTINKIALELQNKFNSVDWEKVGKDALIAIRDGFTATISILNTAILNIATNLSKTFNETDWKQLGIDAITAIKDGFTATAGLIAQTVIIATAIKNSFTSQSWSEIGATILTNIKDGISLATSSISAVMGTIATDLSAKILSTDWNAVGHNVAIAIKDGLRAAVDVAGGLLSSASTIVTEVMSKFTSGDWSGTGTTIMNVLAAAVKAAAYAAAGIIIVVGGIAVGMIEEFTSIDLDTVGQNLMAALATGVSAAVSGSGGLYARIREIGDEIVTIFKAMGAKFKAIGTTIVNSIGEGISGAKAALMKKAQDLANALPGWVQDILGIGSPSKVFMEIGRNIVQGLIVGIELERFKIDQTMRSIASSLTMGEFLSADINVSTNFADRIQSLYIDPIIKQLSSFDALEKRRSELEEKLHETLAEINFDTTITTEGDNDVLFRIQDLRDELYIINSQLQDRLQLEQQISDISFGVEQIKQQQDLISLYTDQISLLEEAASLGLDISHIELSANSDIDSLQQMVVLEEQIAYMKVEQLRIQAATFRQTLADKKLSELRAAGLKQAMAELQPLIDNASNSSIFGNAYKTIVLDPLLAQLQEVAEVESERLWLINAYTEAAQRFANKGIFDKESERLSAQIELLEEAERLGLDISGVSSTGNSLNDIMKLLELEQRVSEEKRNQLFAQAYSLKQSIAERKVLAARAKGIEEATLHLQPLLDLNVASSIGQKYKAQVLDPIFERLKGIAEIGSERNRLIGDYRVLAQGLQSLNHFEKESESLSQYVEMLTRATSLGIDISEFGTNPDQSVAGMQKMIALEQRITQAQTEQLRLQSRDLQQVIAIQKAEDARLNGVKATMAFLNWYIDRTSEVASPFGQMIKTNFLDPLIVKLQKVAGIENERVALMHEYAGISQKLIGLQQIEKHIAVVQNNLDLIQKAVDLGIDVSTIAPNPNYNLNSILHLVKLEQDVAEAQFHQLVRQAEILKQQQLRSKQEKIINNIIGERLLNTTAEGSIAERFRKQFVDPWLEFLYSIDTSPSTYINAFIESANRLENLSQSQKRVDNMQEQIGLLKQMATLGFDLNEAFPNNIFGNMQAGSQMLSIVTRISQATEDALRSEFNQIKATQKYTAALKQLQPLLDQVEVSSVFGQRYKESVLDPILVALQQSAGIDSERVRLMNQYTQAAQKLAEIQRKENQLEYLKQQLDLVKMIRDQDIPGGDSLFAGLTFGLNASIEDLTALTSRVLDGLITQVRQQLGIASPSAVFAKIGSQMMMGMSEGIQSSIINPIRSLRDATFAHGAMSSSTLNFAMGGVTINSGMDEVMFESRVMQIIERSFN